MRIRSTKPEFWRSKTIAQFNWDVRLVLKGLESYVDDNGVGKDDLALIAADVFPRDLSSNPRETLARLSEAISTLADGAIVVRYTVEAENLLYIDRWKELQRIDKPGKGRFPRPDGTFEYNEPVNRESYAKCRESVARVPETVAPGTGEQGNRGTGENSGSESLVSHQGAAKVAPPRKCKRHINDPHPPSCGACAQARRDAEDWESNDEARRRDERRAHSADRQRAAREAAQEIAACPLCDDDGYRGNRVCDHTDRTETAKAGSDRVRAAMTKGTA